MLDVPIASTEKTVIGVLASHDDFEVNRSLVELLNWVRRESNGSQSWKNMIEQFQFVFTGGTYQRVIEGKGWWSAQLGHVDPPEEFSTTTSTWLKKRCKVVRLPAARDGGVTLLANLVAYRQCSILWGLLSPATGHWINPENLALGPV